jgi:NADH-quinone oxidoreductase subunit E
MDNNKIEQIIDKYQGNQNFLIQILLDIQNENNWIPKEIVEKISKTLEVPLNQIYHILTFYKIFSLIPRGRHQLSLCLGTACHVRGAPLVGEHIERVLDLKAGGTSPDLGFSFETVNCLGACALGPILVSDGEYHGQITISKVNKILKNLVKKMETDEED